MFCNSGVKIIAVVWLAMSYCSSVNGQIIKNEKNTLSLFDQAVERASKGLPNTRALGGSQVSFKDNKWQAALLVGNIDDNLQAQFCGGTVVSEKWILTAAHCIDTKKDAARYNVLVGSDNLEQVCCRLTVVDYVVHPDYNEKRTDGISNHDADIALIRVDASSISLMDYVIKLDDRENIDGKDLAATGWGVTERRYQPTKKLVGVVVPVVNRDICNLKKSYGNKITLNMLCAGFELGKVDTCQGDSGGPGTVDNEGQRRLAGVISWGEGCGSAFKYGVYTRVYVYRDWVSKIIKDRK